MWHVEERVTFQDKIEVVFSEKNMVSIMAIHCIGRIGEGEVGGKDWDEKQ